MDGSTADNPRPATDLTGATADTVSVYEPPALTRLGDLAELTMVKTVGAADGATFLGLAIGSV